MKISYSWFNNYLNLDLPPDEISDLLTDIGLEVEGVEEVDSIKGGLKGVVIGEVLTKVQHPNADRLAITTVDVEILSHFKLYAVHLMSLLGKRFQLLPLEQYFMTRMKVSNRKSKIRGEVSQGMICGEDEIGLGEKTDGIMELDQNAKIGMPAGEVFSA